MHIGTGYCPNCGKQVMLRQDDCNHILHLILTLLTGGFWLIVWVCVGSFGRKWRCSQCGSEVKYGSTEKNPNKELSTATETAIWIIGLLIISCIVAVRCSYVNSLSDEELLRIAMEEK